MKIIAMIIHHAMDIIVTSVELIVCIGGTMWLIDFVKSYL
jgi:hypothetical protein